MVLLADRGFSGFPLWQQAAATGADLLWRAKHEHEAHPGRVLADGSWLAEFARRQRRAHTANMSSSGSSTTASTTAAVTDTGPSGCSPRCSIPTRPQRATSPLAYAQRWEIESAFDELKTHQRGAKLVLRSKSPALVEQELWGHLCCHYAIRTLMFEAAHDADVDPDRVSFVAALRIARRSIQRRAIFPLTPLTTAGAHAIGLLLQPLNPVRRQRSNPRLIKRKMPHGTSNAPATATGRNPPAHPSPPSSEPN